MDEVTLKFLKSHKRMLQQKVNESRQDYNMIMNKAREVKQKYDTAFAELEALRKLLDDVG